MALLAEQGQQPASRDESREQFGLCDRNRYRSSADYRRRFQRPQQLGAPVKRRVSDESLAFRVRDARARACATRTIPSMCMTANRLLLAKTLEF
ncbi:MAG TPA: hypothetical protein VGJ84_02655 [Polyangiaceae bacterium]